mmetsp:Transcript_20117/g.61029  ORF Transcript_20117/g.61029 Transcript_20117/m.61029 type:complete len:126 (-) Transcript_20117:296-673(-)
MQKGTSTQLGTVIGEILLYSLIWGTLANFGQDMSRRTKDRLRKERDGYDCDSCKDTYEVECIDCSGKGFVMTANGPERCDVCIGTGFVPCACTEMGQGLLPMAGVVEEVEGAPTVDVDFKDSDLQ